MFEARGTLAAIGIATFGPADIDPASVRWGHVFDFGKGDRRRPQDGAGRCHENTDRTRDGQRAKTYSRP